MKQLRYIAGGMEDNTADKVHVFLTPPVNPSKREPITVNWMTRLIQCILQGEDAHTSQNSTISPNSSFKECLSQGTEKYLI